MRHVVLGAGGIGGLLAALLSRAGQDVTIVERPRHRERHGAARRIAVSSDVFGDFDTDVIAASRPPADGHVDVVWVAVKATGLEEATRLIDPAQVTDAVVVPLLNGVDHVSYLRSRYPSVCGGSIAIQSHRSARGIIEQRGRFAQLSVAVAAGSPSYPTVSQAAAVLQDIGFAVTLDADEVSMLWNKLAFLAPIALATAAWDRSLGGVRQEPRFRAAQAEAVDAAHVDGATTTLAEVRDRTAAMPDRLWSSMHRDVASGREPELDALAGAVLRRLPPAHAAATRALAEMVKSRTTMQEHVS